jgi:hypothetical protein
MRKPQPQDRPNVRDRISSKLRTRPAADTEEGGRFEFEEFVDGDEIMPDEEDWDPEDWEDE